MNNSYRKRKRVDWDAEIKKTDNIKRKGFLISAVSFGAACAFIFGVSKTTGINIEFPRQILSIILLCAAIVIFASVMRRRSKKRNNKKS